MDEALAKRFASEHGLTLRHGRVLWWNDVAWGYLGEPATLHEEGVELVAPKSNRDGCEG